MKGHIIVSELTKRYKTYPSRFGRLLEWLSPVPVKRHRVTTVLDNVSFEVKPGEVVGIIGINGSGKSTLLKHIVGTTKPTSGSVRLEGRVSAILELGMGFHPDFTGRENAIRSAQLLGLSNSEIDNMMPEIESFAEVGEYFDKPVRTYSSGMQVRVAFSVATIVKPDILIIDEALSVGDSYFQHKSFDRIRRFKDEGVTILFVTHSMGDIRSLCDRAILLNGGKLEKDGLPDEIVDYYNAIITEKENTKLSIDQRRNKNGWLMTKSGTGEALVDSISVKDTQTGNELAVCTVGQKISIHVKVKVLKPLNLVLGLMIKDKTGHEVWGTNTYYTGQSLHVFEENTIITFVYDFTCTLGPGSYSITTALASNETHLVDNFEWTDNIYVFDVVNTTKPIFIGTAFLDGNFNIEMTNGGK